MLIAALLALALQDPPPFKQENTPANLKQLLEKLQQATAAGDDKTALALTNSLIPDEAAIKKGLKDDLAPADLAQILEFLKKALPAGDAKRAKLFAADPANTEVRVHSATTEEILKYEKGSTPFMQFPLGAKKIAESVLRPATTFHEVVLARPGVESGVKLHLFYWSGEKWVILGPLWRAFK